MGMYNNRSIFFDPVSFDYEVLSFPEPEKPQTEGQIVDEEELLHPNLNNMWKKLKLLQRNL